MITFCPFETLLFNTSLHTPRLISLFFFSFFFWRGSEGTREKMKARDCKQASSSFWWANIFLSVPASSPPVAAGSEPGFPHAAKNPAGLKLGTFASLEITSRFRQRWLRDQERARDGKGRGARELRVEKETRGWFTEWFLERILGNL